MITAAADLIMVFLALEILSLSLYVLTGITGRRSSNEAAMKYFLLGAFVLGVLPVRGRDGVRRDRHHQHHRDRERRWPGRSGASRSRCSRFAFLAVGFGFKVSAAPFHMWTPDVYQGAPTPVTAYMSAATKVAAFAALIRVLLTWPSSR